MRACFRGVIFFMTDIVVLSIGSAGAEMILMAPAALELESESAPDFLLSGVDSETVSMSDYKGKEAVIVFFWTTWCRFCRSELKEMDKIYDTLQGDGIRLISINIGESKITVDRYRKDLGLKFPIFLDGDSYIAHLYDVLGVPTFVLVNKEGDIVLRKHSFPRNYKDILTE